MVRELFDHPVKGAVLSLGLDGIVHIRTFTWKF